MSKTHTVINQIREGTTEPYTRHQLADHVSDMAILIGQLQSRAICRRCKRQELTASSSSNLGLCNECVDAEMVEAAKLPERQSA